MTTITRKKVAIEELKHLLKTRKYFIRIWENQGIEIEAKWNRRVTMYSIDLGIDLYIKYVRIRTNKSKEIYTIEQIQADLETFTSEIQHFFWIVDELERQERVDKGLDRHLTATESHKYFKELLHITEKE